MKLFNKNLLKKLGKVNFLLDIQKKGLAHTIKRIGVSMTPMEIKKLYYFFNMFGEKAGTYTISIALGDNPNYDITTKTATFTIEPHQWVYSAENNILTAKCSVENCKYDKDPLHLTLVAPTNPVYNGENHFVTISDSEKANWQAEDLAIPTIT